MESTIHFRELMESARIAAAAVLDTARLWRSLNRIVVSFVSERRGCGYYQRLKR
jgi:hypothetical protein